MLVGGSHEGRTANTAGLADVGGIAQLATGRFPDRQRGLGALRDQPPLLLGQCGLQVQHERIGVAPELGNDEGYALRHQAGNESDITRQPIKLRHQNAALCGLGGGEGGCELRPAIKRVPAFAGLGLDKLGDDRDLLGIDGEISAHRLPPAGLACSGLLACALERPEVGGRKLGGMHTDEGDAGIVAQP
jgi:hypothetical protein